MDFKLSSFLKKYNLNLTNQQSRAISDINGPKLILAVPGSGKTTTLVARIGYMIYAHNIDPSEILVMTYTLVASRDMKFRFEKIFGKKDSDKIKFATINSICAGIINRYNPNAFTLESNNRDMIKRTYIQVTGQYPSDFDIKNIQQIITRIKNMRYTNEEIKKEFKDEDYDCYSIYKAYKENMRSSSLMDFDDQLVYALKILLRYPDILSYYQKKYRYLLIDEAQDTSKIQHDIIRLLVGNNQNVFMVGDEDQSIYGFRGAYPQALMEFNNIYPKGKIFKLEVNFRSTPQIVNASNKFIDKNKNRYKKHMTAFCTKGENINYINCPRNKQYQHITDFCSQSPKETAILYRNNDSSVPLIYTFAKEGIPCKWRDTDNIFFKSPTYLMVINFLKLIINPLNTEAFSRVYSKLGVPIKKELCENVITECHLGSHNSIFTALEKLTSHRKDCSKFEKIASDFSYFKFCDAPKVLNHLSSNYNSYKDEERYFILKQLAEPNESVEDFLMKLQNLETYISHGTQFPHADTIFSTIHSSKGLEYEQVILIDINEGVFSMFSSTKDKSSLNELEEDRRLFYVGCTRAKSYLKLIESTYSPFIRDFLGLKPPKSAKTSISRSIVKNNIKDANFDKAALTKAGYIENAQIIHKSFGRGKILSINGSTATISFASGNKTLSLDVCINRNIISLL